MPMILRLRRMAASRTGVSKKDALASFGKDEDACRPTAVVFEDLNPATRAMAVSSRSSSSAADTDPFHDINTSIRTRNFNGILSYRHNIFKQLRNLFRCCSRK